MKHDRFALAWVVLLAVAAVPAYAAETQPTRGTSDAVQALAFDMASHPDAEAVDLYKFLHQAMFGPGHAISDPAQAGESLRSEIDGLGSSGATEAWCDSLGGEPFLVRVNLRPFAANGFDAGELVEAFVATANSVRGDPRQMEVALELVVGWLSSDGRNDLAEQLRTLGREMKKKGYPPVHHSAGYRQAYSPAYRVVEAALASAHGWCGSTY